MSAFLAVADEKSFTKAAKRLGVTQSALSHAIRGLEEQVGVRLLARTTRSVAPTEAGEQLLAELRPALTGIRGALDRIGGLRDPPRGRLRLLVPRLAAMSVLGPKLADVRTKLPGRGVGRQHRRNEARPGRERLRCRRSVRRVHPTRHGGGSRLTRSPTSDCRLTGYFADHPKPTLSARLAPASCVNYRHGSGEIYRWELDKGDQSVVVAVNGPLITNDIGF